MAKLTKRKSLEKKLDIARSKRVKEKSMFMCEKCLSRDKRLNSHHLRSRSKKSLRWDLDNGICLCVSCHVFSSSFSAHKTPVEFVERLKVYIWQDKYDRLRQQAYKIRKYTLDELEEILIMLTNDN